MKDYESWPGRAEWQKIGAVIDLAAVAVVFAMGFVFIVGTPLAATALIGPKAQVQCPVRAAFPPSPIFKKHLT